ncbi:MAG: hypothetical protein JO089_02060 [Alphaproteobacteria bacterium]|nr:hypothetical protein [Alphaproteobacteria bacterium]
MLSEALMQNLFGFASGLIGAAVGGVFTLYAARQSIVASVVREQKQDEKEMQNMLEAMGVEMSTLWDFHMMRVGERVEQLRDGEALEFYYPLTQDYFTIYDTNASKIGLVKDPALRKAIVVCYNKCKKVVDGFKYNNELYRDYAQAASVPVDLPQQRKLVEAKRGMLSEYAKIIRSDHFELKAYVEELTRLLPR